MPRSFRIEARVVRALIAMCLAAGLGMLLFMDERTQSDLRSHALFEAATLSWKVSELIFETQRLSTGLDEYALGTISQSDLDLRFDLMWSRHDVVRATAAGQSEGFQHVLQEVERFLTEEETAIYNVDKIPDDVLERVGRRLDELSRLARVTWVDVFIGRYNQVGFLSEIFKESAAQRNRWIMIGLITMLMIYVLTEVFYASAGQLFERKLRQEAAEANAAKTRFLANVSHEIRTPLNGILGMTSELASTPLSEEQARCLQVIEDSGGILLGTINDVLDLSSVEAGEFRIEERPFVVRDMLSAAVDLYAARAREKGLSLELEISRSLPPFLRGDGRRLRQVLHNLVANAVKFTEEGGVNVDVTIEGDWMRVAVSDTGPGVPVAQADHIFEAFGQADDSASRAHGGTGLGLTISRQICEAMGGALTLEPRDGAGACFVMRLPIVAASAKDIAQKTATAAVPPDLSHCRVLVADDNSTNRMIIGRFMKETGADVSFAATGREALLAAQEQRFDVILMDIQMPEMDGVTCTRAVRAFQAGADEEPSLIVAVTANVLPDQVEAYFEASMDEVLPKPVSKPALMALMTRLHNAKVA